MTIEATPNNESGTIFLEEPVDSINEFGGENYQPREESTPESRGDILIDDVIEDEEPMEAEEEPEAEEEEPEEDAESETDDTEDADAESDSDDDDSTDSGDDADEYDGKPKKPIPDKIPRKRLNKEVERRKAAENRVRELEAAAASNQQPAVPQGEKINPKVDPEKFKEMQDAMLDGETDKAMEIYTELQAATVNQVLEASDARLDEQLAIREQNKELRDASVSVRESFPELDPNNDDFDESLTEDVVATRDFYMTHRKLSPGEALKRAAKEVANDYGLEDRAKPAEAPKPKPKARKTDVKRKMEAAEKEMGKLGGQSAGNKSELPDVSKLTDAQFAKLDPKVKAKLRGDII